MNLNSVKHLVSCFKYALVGLPTEISQFASWGRLSVRENISMWLLAYGAFGFLCDTSQNNSPVWWQFTGGLNKKSARGPQSASFTLGNTPRPTMGPQGVGSCKPPRAKLTCSFFLFIFISPTLCGSVISVTCFKTDTLR